MIEVFDCDQGSEEWLRCRLGLPTASEFATVLAKGKGGGESLTRAKYLRTLAAEIVTGEPGESYSNAFMERGKAQEAEARSLYAFTHDCEPALVGFIRSGGRGCSPDALIGSDGLLEVKTRMGHLQVELLLRDEFPLDHRAQCQGNLLVTEREWIDLACYSPGLPLFVSRQYRDDEYIRSLDRAIGFFNEELATMVERIRRYGTTPRAVVRAALEASVA
jgi:hypothetical protein